MVHITDADTTGRITLEYEDHLSFASLTDVGLIREHNEDSLVALPPLFAICDGMGGHEAGEVASRIAVETLVREAPAHADPMALASAVTAANRAVIEGALRGDGKPGMGTTCTAAIIEGASLVIAQVGDSRAYLLRDGRLTQLTRDHSLVADWVEQGRITPEEARVNPQRSVITRALGSDPNTQPDIYELQLLPQDWLLINSDGLSSMVTDDEIEMIMRASENPEVCTRELVQAALDAGGHDNVSVVVIEMTGDLPVNASEDESAAETSTATVPVLVDLAADKDAQDAGVGGANDGASDAESASKAAWAIIPATGGKRRKRFVVAFVATLVIIAAIALGGTYAYARHVAYLIDEGGYIAVYQGFPDEVAGISLRWYVKTTDVATADLSESVAQRLHDGIRTDSLAAADELLNDYRQQIAAQQVAQYSDFSSSSDTATSDDAAVSPDTEATSEDQTTSSGAAFNATSFADED